MGKNPSHFKGDYFPVTNVSWDEVQEFINKLNREEEKKARKVFCRLPTEAQWEYAARAGQQNVYSFGSDATQLDEYAWYSKNSEAKMHRVGTLMPNAWGLYDMHGNVWEWVQDWEGPYTAEAVTDPKGPAGGRGRIIRGGDWLVFARDARSAKRQWVESNPNFRFINLGFRCLSSGVSQ